MSLLRLLSFTNVTSTSIAFDFIDVNRGDAILPDISINRIQLCRRQSWKCHVGQFHVLFLRLLMSALMFNALMFNNVTLT
jgi:hypothetical protein